MPSLNTRHLVNADLLDLVDRLPAIVLTDELLPIIRASFGANISKEEEPDVLAAVEVARRTAAANDHVLPDPAPWAKPSDLKDSTVTLKLRCWTHVDGYWDVRFDVLKAVKQAFDAESISLPYPIQVSVPAPTVAAAPAAAPSYSQGGPDGAG